MLPSGSNPCISSRIPLISVPNKENTEKESRFTIDATANFNDRGLITSIDGSGDYTDWFAPFLANINGNSYVNHIWGYRSSFQTVSSFGKIYPLQFAYDDKGILTRLNEYTYSYEDGLCTSAIELKYADETDYWSFSYNEDLTSCTIKNLYPTTPTDTYTLNNMKLIKKHHFLLAGRTDEYRVFEYNESGVVTKCNGISFEYDKDWNLISASNNETTVTYHYIYE